MIIPEDSDAEITNARESLNLAMQLLTKVLDNPPSDVTPDELEVIRSRRARNMFESAQRLYNAVTGRRTR